MQGNTQQRLAVSKEMYWHKKKNSIFTLIVKAIEGLQLFPEVTELKWQ